MSVREAADLVNIAKDTAMRSFHTLERIGFIRRHVCGSFNWKRRHATTWILAEFPLDDAPATKDFMSWKPPKISKRGPNSRTKCPEAGTTLGGAEQAVTIFVLIPGPWLRLCTL